MADITGNIYHSMIPTAKVKNIVQFQYRGTMFQANTPVGAEELLEQAITDKKKTPIFVEKNRSGTYESSIVMPPTGQHNYSRMAVSHLRVTGERQERGSTIYTLETEYIPDAQFLAFERDLMKGYSPETLFRGRTKSKRAEGRGIRLEKINTSDSKFQHNTRALDAMRTESGFWWQ